MAKPGVMHPLQLLSFGPIKQYRLSTGIVGRSTNDLEAARDRTASAKFERSLAEVAVSNKNSTAVPPIVRPVHAAVIDNRRIVTIRVIGRVSAKTWESEPYAD